MSAYQRNIASTLMPDDKFLDDVDVEKRFVAFAKKRKWRAVKLKGGVHAIWQNSKHFYNFYV